MGAEGKAAVFWDYENCRSNSLSGYEVVERIRRLATVYGDISLFKAYAELSDVSAKSMQMRSELQCSGVSLTDCPHNGRKDVADKMLLVDMLAFALDNPAPATIMLISNDRDMAYAAAVLRHRRYRVVLLSVTGATHDSLKMQASVLYDWNKHILGRTSSDTVVLTSASTLVPQPSTERPPAKARNVSTAEVPRASIVQPALPDSTSDRVQAWYEAMGVGEGASSSQEQVEFQAAVDVHPVQRMSPAHPGRDNGSLISSTLADSEPEPPALPEPFSLTEPLEPPTIGEVDRILGQQLVEGDVGTNNSSKEPSNSSQTPTAFQPRADGDSGKNSSAMALRSWDVFANLRQTVQRNCSSEPSFSRPASPSRCAEARDTSVSNSLGDAEPISSSLSIQASDHASVPSTPRPSPPETPSRLQDMGLNVCAPSPAFPSIAPTPLSAQADCIGSQQAASPLDAPGLRAEEIVSSALQPLVNRLNELRKEYCFHPLRSFVSSYLELQCPDTFDHACVSSYSEYFSLAVKANVAEIGGEGAQAWISLLPQSNQCNHEALSLSGVAAPTSGSSISLVGEALLESSATAHSGAGTTVIVSQATLPPKFVLLAELLEVLRTRGVLQPLRSTVCFALLQRHYGIFQAAGVSRFREYAALAEAEGIVELGGRDGYTWIALHPKWHGKISLSSWPQTYTLPAPTDTSSKPSTCAPSSIPPLFAMLAEELERSRVQMGQERPLRSTVVDRLLKRDPNFYKAAGAPTFKHYADLAAKEGVVELGGSRGNNWMSLHPRWRGKFTVS